MGIVQVESSPTQRASVRGWGFDAGIEAAIDTYGKSERNKYRAVFYYLLVKHFGKESAYK
jgi:hypothetical protein